MQSPNRSSEELLRQAFSKHQAASLKEARVLYLEILSANPGHFDANHMLALLEAQEQQLLSSINLLCRALALRPDHIPSHWHLGEAFIQMEYYEAAIASFRRARQLNPTYLEAWVREANLLEVLGLADEAMWAYGNAITLDPLNEGIRFSAANTLKSTCRYIDAIRQYRMGLIIAPGQFDVYVNMGNALKELNQLDPALAAHGRAARLQPFNPLPSFNLSLIFLLRGDYVPGWQLFETRWSVVLQSEKREFRKPRWTGRESLLGKTILVYPEQGLGDTIQFCRYLPLLLAKGARVVFEAPDQLRGLLKTLPGAINLLQPGLPTPDYDFQIPLLSIPGALGTRLSTIPSTIPYLKVPSERVTYWKSRLKETARPRIGLVWSGGTLFRNDINRSLTLEKLKSLIDLPFDFHSLQKVIREQDQETLSEVPNLTLHGEDLHDFSDTAALIEGMDLVLSVDTSVAHLAGALGKKVWIFLPFAPDYRWLLDREDSPWYPTARLFRQKEDMDWSGVIAEVGDALLEYLSPT